MRELMKEASHPWETGDVVQSVGAHVREPMKEASHQWETGDMAQVWVLM